MDNHRDTETRRIDKITEKVIGGAINVPVIKYGGKKNSVSAW